MERRPPITTHTETLFTEATRFRWGRNADEPGGEGRGRIVEDAVPAPGPDDVLGSLAPEALGILQRAAVDLVKAAQCLLPFLCPARGGPLSFSTAILRQSGPDRKSTRMNSSN